MADRLALRKAVLQMLGGAGTDRRLGSGQPYFMEALNRATGEVTSATEVTEVCWQLLSDGLVFLDFARQSSSDNWKWALTERGHRALLSDRDYEPDDPVGYLALLQQRMQGLDPAVRLYASEALRAYAGRCYLSSSVMLGVASERAFLLLAEAFLNVLQGDEAERFRSVLSNQRQTFHAKFIEFRKRFEPKRDLLPPDLSDNLALTFDGVLDLLRVTRNESGHPTGRELDRQDAYVNLQLFGRYMERLAALRSHFQTISSPNP